MASRNTKARLAIIESLRIAGRPMSVSEILESASTKRADINKSTVYRFIKQLMQVDEVVAISINAHATLFELKGAKPHHHFTCNECLTTFCLENQEVNLRTLLPQGFEVGSSSLLLSGRCPGCSKS